MTTLVGVTSAYGNAGSVTINVPAGTADGDWLIWYSYWMYDTRIGWPNVNTPPTWIANFPMPSVGLWGGGADWSYGWFHHVIRGYWKRASGEPASHTITNTHPTYQIPLVTMMVSFRGAVGNNIDLYWLDGASTDYNAFTISNKIPLYMPADRYGFSIGSICTTPFYFVARPENCTFAADAPFSVLASTSNAAGSMAFVALPGFADFDLRTADRWDNWVGSGLGGYTTANKKVTTSVGTAPSMSASLWIRDTPPGDVLSETFDFSLPFANCDPGSPVSTDFSSVQSVSDESYVAAHDCEASDSVPSGSLGSTGSDDSGVEVRSPLDAVPVNTVVPIVDD